MFNLKVYTMKRQRFFEGLGLKVYVTLAICMALLLNVQFLNAQSSTINVKGVVNDAMGPVIGASVVEKGPAVPQPQSSRRALTAPSARFG